MAVPLNDIQAKENGVIKQILDNPFDSQLLEFGIQPGVNYAVLNRAPFKGPIFIRIENSRIALRWQEAAFIIVE
jgi:Fe2+ transport system protein FeoA